MGNRIKPAWIKTRATKRTGLAFDLYYRWKGQRYRPLLGFDLTPEEAEERAAAMIQKIQHGMQSSPMSPPTKTTPPPTGPHLQDVIQLYWDSFVIKGRVDAVRPQQIITLHLLPFFGSRPIKSLTSSDGLAYIKHRLAEKAQAGTIHREWNVLMRLLNLAVRYDQLDRNRLEGTDLPQAARRERTAEIDEIVSLASTPGRHVAELMRVVWIALHTGLRQGKIFAIRREWIRKHQDGFWLHLPPSKSHLKGTPKTIPLNRIAVAALEEATPSLNDSRVFRHWENARAFKNYWTDHSVRAKILGLHFHDLRHTFTTVLQGLGIDYEVRQALLGHKMPGVTATYSHGGPEWDKKLRTAVTKLEKAFVVSYDSSYERATSLVAFQRLDLVSRLGVEPRTLALKGRCSTS